MDLDLFSRWVAVIALLIGIVNTMLFWLMHPARIAKQRHESVLNNLKEHDRRIQRVEDKHEHMPTKDDLFQVKEQLGRMDTEVEAIGHMVRRIDDYLRNKT